MGMRPVRWQASPRFNIKCGGVECLFSRRKTSQLFGLERGRRRSHTQSLREMSFLRLFGYPTLQRHGGGGPIGLPPKAVALLALLVAHVSRPLSRDWAAQTLWPDAVQSDGRANLRRHLHLIAKALGNEALLLTRQTMQWNASSGIAVDVARFDASSGTQPQAAVDAYTGELCAGIEDEALDELRVQYRREYERLLRSLLDRSKNACEREDLLVWLQRLVAHDPLDDKAVRELMKARYEAGDRAGAIRDYNALVQRLRAELDVEPQVETATLFSVILGADASSEVPNNLVNAPTTFVGREREIAAIIAELRDSRALTLLGPGGIGKSRLATRVSFDVLSTYPQGVWFVDLEHAKDEPDVWAAIGEAARVPAADTTEHAVLRAFASARALVVLDTCEHVAGAATRIVEKLLACTTSAILATSRRRLGAAAMRELEIRALEIPPAVIASGDSPMRYSAYRLFVERAAMVNPAFRAESGNLVTLTKLLNSIDGLPLAIELVASRANMLTIEGMRRRLTEALRTARAQTDQRNLTMDAALNWSYELLSPREQQFFAELSVFRAGFTPEDVESICGQMPHAVDMLFRLVDASLVSVVHGKDETRYRLLETTRGFALEKLLVHTSAGHVLGAHAKHFAAKAEALAPVPETAFVELLESISLTMPDYLGALDYAVEKRSGTLGLQILEGLHRFGIRQHFNAELLARGAKLSEQKELAPAERARIARLTGMLGEASGRYALSMRLFANATAYYREHGDERELCDALTGIAVDAYHLGRYKEAERSFLEICERSERAGETLLHLKTLGRLGALYLSQAQFEKALPLLESAASGLRGLGEIRQLSFALKNLGTAAHYAGQHRKAITWIDQALECTERTSEIAMHAMALCLRGSAQRELSEINAGLDSLLAASRLFPGLEESSDLAECLEDVTSMLIACSQYERAARLMGFTDALRDRIGSPLNPGLRSYYDRDNARLHRALGAAFDERHARGEKDDAEIACRIACQALNELREGFIA